jgi:O-methyltransferase involved in polyketide biosynthesis
MLTPRSAPVPLDGVQETLLVPLWSRAVESARPGGVLRDPRAQEIVEALDYDFARFEPSRHLAFRACLRTVLVDRWVHERLRVAPDSTVVELGAGLNTRFERVDNGLLRWFDLDLPEAMALRRRFFEDTERRTQLEADLTDPTWHDRIEARGPLLFLAEAVLLYLEPEIVRRSLRTLATRFPGAWFVFDTVDALASKRLSRPMMQGFRAPFLWSVEDPAELSSFGCRPLRTTAMIDLPADLLARVPLRHRLAFAWMRWRRPEVLRSHRLHLCQLDPSLV